MTEDQETDWHRTTIRLSDKHQKIIEENGLNLSKWVRKQLEKQFENP